MKLTVTKEICSDENQQEASLHFLVMCDFISKSSTYVSWRSRLTLSLRNLSRASLDRTESYAEKENIISSERESSLMRNFFVICEFKSKSYSLVLRKQFAKILFVVSAKWSLGDRGGPWWKRKYPQIITRDKLSERLCTVVWLHHTEFHPTLLGTVC